MAEGYKPALARPNMGGASGFRVSTSPAGTRTAPPFPILLLRRITQLVAGIPNSRAYCDTKRVRVLDDDGLSLTSGRLHGWRLC